MPSGKMHPDEIHIDVALVRRLLAAQFPQWVDLPLTPAVPQGWDNRTFRLGAELSVRLPSAVGYTPQIAKEHHWLPFLAPRLPLPIPVPLALGAPGWATRPATRWRLGPPGWERGVAARRWECRGGDLRRRRGCG